MDIVFPAVAACGFVWSFFCVSSSQKQAEKVIQQWKLHVQNCPQCATENDKRMLDKSDQRVLLFDVTAETQIDIGEPSKAQSSLELKMPIQGVEAKTVEIPKREAMKNTCEETPRSTKKLKSSGIVSKRERTATKKTQQNGNLVCNRGRITKNPFFNFVREVRQTMCGEAQTVIVKEAARRWHRLSFQEKCEYSKCKVCSSKSK